MDLVGSEHINNRSDVRRSNSRHQLSSWTSHHDHSQSSGNVHEQNHHAFVADLQDRATITDGDDVGWDAPRAPRQNWTGSGVERDEFLHMKQKVAMLERRLLSSTGSSIHRSKAQNIAPEDAPPDMMGSGLDDKLADRTEQAKILPYIKKRSFEDFSNKYADDEYEYAIELLMRNLSSFRAVEPGPTAGKSSIDHQEAESFAENQVENARQGAPSENESTPGRIRINSPWILSALSRIHPEIDPTAPLVMLRPWKFLAHHEHRIRQLVQSFDNKHHCNIVASDGGNKAATAGSTNTTENLTLTPDEARHHEEVQHLRCLVEFLDQYIKPMKEQFDGDSQEKIRFKDMWWLFSPGDDIYMPVKVRGRKIGRDQESSVPETFQSRYEKMWRVTATSGGCWNLAGDHAVNTKLQASPFRVSCYFIDFDGKYFLPVTHTFMIQPFDGEVDIRALDFYPARYMYDASHKMERNSARGRWVFDQMSRRSTHFYYAGPTLVVHPCGCPLQGETLHQEHVESEVIVDFASTLLKNPAWRPRSDGWKPPLRTRRQTEIITRQWSDRTSKKSLGVTYDNVYDEYSIDLQRAINFRDKEPIFAPVPMDWISNRSSMPAKDVPLLTTRGFAFVLRTRTFAPISLLDLCEIKAQSDGLEDLQLKDNSVKEGIRALVRTHFKQDEEVSAAEETEYDLVRGKGKGLVILLHGAPGVGKTSTAESVAAANGKPLFQITCGDLGLTPGEVERALKEIFRYAQMWRCILLLDECDVFLSARTKGDTQRNSLVSVFLRVLEFYTGVLFLTTNRLGVLDAAVRSRITWPIYYPPLDSKQTYKIWMSNLRLLEKRNKDVEIDRDGIMRFAKHHFKSRSEAQPAWNGRQIQNAFKVAMAFAEWERMTEDERYSLELGDVYSTAQTKLQLVPAHFEKIASVIQAFDRYLHVVTGTSESQRAWHTRERADEHDPDNDDELANTVLSPPVKDLKRSPSLQAGFGHGRKTSMTSATNQTNGMDYEADRGPRSGGYRSSDQVSAYHASPTEVKTGFAGSGPHQTHARRQSGKLMAGQVATTTNMLQPEKKRRRLSDMGTQHQITGTRMPSIDFADMTYEQNGKRKRQHGQFLAIDGPPGEEEAIDAASSDDGWQNSDDE